MKKLYSYVFASIFIFMGISMLGSLSFVSAATAADEFVANESAVKIAFAKMLKTGKTFSSKVGAAFSSLDNATASVGGIGVVGIGFLIGINIYFASENVPLGRFLIYTMGCMAGGLTWLKLTDYFYDKTPTGCMEYVEKVLDEIECDDFIVRKFEKEMDFVGAINVRFPSNWPLIDARNLFVSFGDRLKTLKTRLFEARKEITNPAVRYRTYADACDSLSQKIDSLIKNIEQQMHVILLSKDFSEQLKLYDKSLETEK